MIILTKKQKKVFEVLRAFFESEDRPPTTRELARILECNVKTIYQYIKILERKGFVERKHRRIFIAQDYRKKGLPLLGKIAAGVPILAEENFEGFYSLDDDLCNKGDCLLRVEGDSMINAHICHNDFVIVKQQPNLENGEIGAVLVGNEATVKRVNILSNEIQLVPENDAYEIMKFDPRVSEIRIIGKVIGVVRNAL